MKSRDLTIISCAFGLALGHYLGDLFVAKSFYPKWFAIPMAGICIGLYVYVHRQYNLTRKKQMDLDYGMF